MQNGCHRTVGVVGVVDDDDAVRDSLQFLLETAGFSVATGTTQWSIPGEYQCMGPLAFLTASASLVHCEISRRSNCAKLASMFAIASPVSICRRHS